MDLKNVKLIIWDLDDTFWHGTLAENDEIIIPDSSVELVKKFAERGIVSSICSKNDEKKTINVLKRYGINDYFVFKSINWDPKGPRIKEIIKRMNLKDASVLFIDDNPSNLGEAKSFCPNIMTAGPDVFESLLNEVSILGKDDKGLSRLHDYQVLEKKYNVSIKYKSVDKFLKQSNIEVSIHKDCIPQIDRIYELVHRTNQLNYTKKRISLDELKLLLNNGDYFNAYISCKDKYGDYGIIGFFSLNKQNNQLEHFLFSCRTMGMGIESYIYTYLNSPKIDIIQPVTMELISNGASYIKLVEYKAKIKKTKKKDIKVFMRGPCDLEALAYYLKDTNITKEFAYVGEHGVSLYQIGHSQVLVDSYDYQSLHSSFVEDKMYETKLYSDKYDVVIFSILTEAQFGIYETKDDRRIVYGECYRDAFNQYEYKDFQHGFYNLPKESFAEFKNYKFIGRISIDNSIANYEKIINRLSSDTKIIFLLGPTKPVPDEMNYSIRYLRGEQFYKELNNKLLALKKKYPNVFLVNPKTLSYKNRYFDFKSSTHYSRSTYYKMAKCIGRITKHNIKASRKEDIVLLLKRIGKKIERIIMGKSR